MNKSTSTKYRRGSAMILTMWMVLALAALTLTFSHTQLFQYRTSNHVVAKIQAQRTVDGAALYVRNLLNTRAADNKFPDRENYSAERVELGSSRFWFLGQATTKEPGFGLIDEASKLNINTAPPSVLQLLPGMTPEIAAAIKDWRDGDSEIEPGGAEDETYSRLGHPYRTKNGKFETIYELALVHGVTSNLLYGKDKNLNGIIEPWEETENSMEDLGILHYVTVYTRDIEKGKIDVNDTTDQNKINLANYLKEKLVSAASKDAVNALDKKTKGLLSYFISTGLKPEEFAKFDDKLFSKSAAYDLININTATKAVLMCLPGIKEEKADQLTAYRAANSERLNSVAWVRDAVDDTTARAISPYITTNSYQFTADICAVGAHGRGYQRTQIVFDTSNGDAVEVYRRDRSHLPWCLGEAARTNLSTEEEK